MVDDSLYARLSSGGRIWAVGAVNGQYKPLRAVHRQLADKIRPGDRLVYLGNYFGDGERVPDCIDELLLFRRAFLALEGVEYEDLAYLRGANEEMLAKLLQLHFAPNPAEVYQWMMNRGLAGTVRGYGAGVEEGLLIARQGSQGISKWTGSLRKSLRARDGHTQLLNHLSHAAYTADGRLLFVHAGLDGSRPLTTQSDSFWWDHASFDRLEERYFDFDRIIRGSSRQSDGVVEGRFTLSIDGGCGAGGPLLAVLLSEDGSVDDVLSGAP